MFAKERKKNKYMYNKIKKCGNFSAFQNVQKAFNYMLACRKTTTK
jgi:hypothetical protein